MALRSLWQRVVLRFGVSRVAFMLVAATFICASLIPGHGRSSSDRDPQSPASSSSEWWASWGNDEGAADAVRAPRRRQVIKAGGIPEEGFGSTLGFLRATASIAHVLDADLIISQTATFKAGGYRASDYLNRGREVQGGGRVCDILEILEEHPDWGQFQERMDRAMDRLWEFYDLVDQKCRDGTTDDIWSPWALQELEKCDTIIVNDYRIVSRGWNLCSQAWWKEAIDAHSGPAHGNDVAIHFRWGDMYEKAQTEDKWKLDMAKIVPLIAIIREENPSVKVRVFMKRSRENESEKRLREILHPLAGEYEIMEAEDDVEELSIMAKARYLFINSGSFSTAAAATRAADTVVYNNGGGRALLGEMSLEHLWHYDNIDLGEFRQAVRQKLQAKV